MQLEQSIQPVQPLVPHPPEERGILAPKEGLETRKVELQSEGYDEKLKAICDQIDKECDERAEIRARRYTRNHNYYIGGERRWQYWTKDGFKSLDRKMVKRLFSNNQFASQLNTLIATVTRAKPRLSISPAPAISDDAEKVSAAQVATRTVQHDQRERLTGDFMQREWMDKFLYGFAARGQWYSKEGSTSKARAPKIEMQEQQMPGMYVCPGCGMTGPDDGQEVCEHCQSPIEKFPGETMQVPVHAGYEEVQDGDCLTYRISPYEFDLAPEAFDLPSSAYARWQREVRTSKLKRAYPKLKLEDLSNAEVPMMLRAQKAMTKKGNPSESNKAFTVLKTYWISVDDYFEFASQKPFEAISGYQIPAGTSLSDLCPNGLRVDRTEKGIIDIRPEVKEDCLSYSAYHVDPQSWEAKGLDDAVELQRWIDDIWTLYVQIQLREALGITGYDKEMFSNGKFTGEVGTVVGIDVPQEKKLEDAIHNWAGQQPNVSLFKGMEFSQQSQTNTTGAFPALNGSNMEGSETARGRVILREQALQGMGPPLYLAARHDIVWAKQNLKLKKKYWTSDRYVPYLEEGEPLGGKWFGASDIDADFIVDVEADSWMPVTRMDAIDQITTFMGGEEAVAMQGGFAGPAVPKAIKQRAAQLLNVPQGTDPEEKDLRNARHRYDVLKRVVERVMKEENQGGEKVPDELNSPLLVPLELVVSVGTVPSIQPLPGIDNDATFIEFYTNAIKDAVESEGIENQPLTKAVLMYLVQGHKQNGLMAAQETAMLTVAAQQPIMDAENDAEAGKADQTHQQEMEKTGAANEHDLQKTKMAHKQGLEKDAKAGEMRLGETREKGKLEMKKASLLSKAKTK